MLITRQKQILIEDLFQPTNLDPLSFFLHKHRSLLKEEEIPEKDVYGINRFGGNNNEATT